MLRCYILAFIFAIASQSGFSHPYHDQQVGSINWMTNYEAAVNKAKEASLPLFIFFTGSDWCTWCSKLEEEALDTPEFADAAGKKFVFLKVDFPRETPQDPAIKQQNKQLQAKFNVRSYPTIVIFDQKQQQQIGVTGYRPGGGRQFASHVLKMVSDYQNYTKKMQNVNNPREPQLSGVELKQLYEKSRELGLNNDFHPLIQLGLNSNQKSYFQLEHYRLLAEEGLSHSADAANLRQQLLSEDPTNEDKTHYKVAVIDFEAYSDDLESAPEKAVAPLVAYIEKFGKQDKENLWRLNMIISQVYLDKNKLPQALRYAQSCYETAPPTVQPEIATAIKNIQAQSQ